MPGGNKDKKMFSEIVAEKDTEARERLIERLAGEMTLVEKLAQMGGAAKLKELVKYGSGTFNNGGCERLGLPKVRFTDGPRGVMLNRSTCFPVTMARGATWDAELQERVGEAMGAESREQGANMSGSVCINLLRHPAWGRAQETYGEDTYLLGELGAAHTRGLQKHVMACAKHFACNSIENARFMVNVIADERTLREVYLPHFKKCVDAGVATIMGAYNRLNGPHCCQSRALLTDLLKDEWGFDGFVVSDWTFALRGADAAAAGLDIEMPNGVFFGLPLWLSVKIGGTPMERIDDAVKRITRKLAEFETARNDNSPCGRVASKEHIDLAREAAHKGIVLLKNDKALLPLDRSKIKSVAVIGELADMENTGDKGSSQVKPPYVVTLLEGIKNRAGERLEIKYSNGSDLDEAQNAAALCDVVVVVAGYTSSEEGEFIPILTKGGDRDSLSLPRKHIEMIKAAAASNRKCVVALEGGSAIMMEEWIDDVAAVLMVWYPGMEGGNAFADILFGVVNPSGKLPLTIPRDSSQLPPFDKWAREIKYEYFCGYRLFDKQKMKPRYHFGYGISYTTYEYSNLRVIKTVGNAEKPIVLKVDVKNTGDRAGEEIVQMYVSCPGSAVERSERELKGFSRVALKPGEKKTVAFKILGTDLAYYDADQKCWMVEDIEYEAYVGPSSNEADLKLSAAFRIGK